MKALVVAAADKAVDAVVSDAEVGALGRRLDDGNGSIAAVRAGIDRNVDIAIRPLRIQPFIRQRDLAEDLRHYASAGQRNALRAIEEQVMARSRIEREDG